MRLTKNQRIALGTLGAAVVVLVVDKAVVQPGAASASETTVNAVDTPAITGPKLPGSAEHLSANLSVVAMWAETSGDTPADPFAWNAVSAPVVTIDPEATLAETASNWMVSSIMGTPGNRIAVINGVPVRVDETVAFGFADSRFAKVVEIRQQSVILYHDGETVTLSLPVNTLSDVPATRS